ncbi:MAG: chemotaxis protein CheA, partial [Limisphaerales bacterium]
MNEPQAKVLASLSALADKIALELVFTQPDSDGGLLPINSFITDLEDCGRESEISKAIQEAICKGREFIDQVFEAGQFTRSSLEYLNAWVTWFQAVLMAVQAEKPAPDFTAKSSGDSQLSSPSNGQLSKRTPRDNEPIILDLENDRDVLTEFIQESREHLQNIESGALALEENPTEAEALNSLFRAFHTFKGGSGFLKLAPINKLAHELESLLDLARQNRLSIDSTIIEIILNGGDALKQFVDAIDLQLTKQTPAGPIVIPTDLILERISKTVTAPNGQNLSEAASPTDLLRKEISEQIATSISKGSPSASNATVKVDTQKLDALIDMVGEMVIAQSLVAEDPDVKALASSRINRSLSQLARTTKDLQRTAMALRMVPLGATFRKMSRIVRDLSMRSGKQIELVLQGDETELDRNIVEEINDPLLHMIRNSVDHGIEQPELRIAAGKSPIGQITLSAFHQGGNVVIQIEDDGAGLNCERILKKATALGLMQVDDNPSQAEIFNLIFAPGFSTAEAITEISGRGVGMDVVRQNIEKLRGRIEIQSTPGRGATFSIYLPLTLAIIDGLIVRVGSHRYILPALSVRESLRPTTRMLSTVHGQGQIIDVRGRLLPLVRLNEFLSIK